ncbi:MAG: FecR family protein [Patescibacteria group bacterium]|nr:FecR family protein [Patescibacteria group bacterium]
MIICVGVILVLSYQLYVTITEEVTEDKVYVHVAAGKAKFLPWGTSNWQNVYSGMNLLPGDALRTSKEGRAVLEFFNGSYVRLESNSEIILQEVVREDEFDNMTLVLNDGEIWIDEHADIGKTSAFSVRTQNVLFRSVGTTFDVANDDFEGVRVMRGKVNAEIIIYEEGEEVVVETIEVGIGQEVLLSETEILDLKARKSLNVLAAISDEFEDADWYQWNMKEDLTPTNFVADVTEEGEIPQERVAVRPMEVDDDFEDTDPPGFPVILEPADENREVAKGPVTISGTTDPDTQKIIIETITEGDSERYTLSKYIPGSTTWSYTVSEGYGNLKPGENRYLIYAVDEALNESTPSELVVNYTKPTQEQLGEFSAPIAVSYNGSFSNEVTKSVVLVKGQVSGAVSVTINDYTLTQFKPGDKEWLYYANEQHGNMNPGLNEYNVYAMDAEGNKSEIVKFEIMYKKEGVELPYPYTAEAQ